MRLGYDLTIEQVQKLTMTPELIQAIQILQYNSQELEEFVSREIMENPLLEHARQEDEPREEQPAEERTRDDQSEEFNFEELREKIMEGAYDDISYSQWKERPSDQPSMTFDQYTSKEETLSDHLKMQLGLSRLNDLDMKIGRFLVDALDDNGYLTMDTSQVAYVFGTNQDEVEKVLKVIQSFEPVGIGARDLKECLLLQLNEVEDDFPKDSIRFVICNFLKELGDNHIQEISRCTGLTAKQVQAVADFIRTLDPKPGRAFSSGEQLKYVIPDVIVEEVDGGFELTTNYDAEPHLMVSQYYLDMARDHKDDEEVQKYLNDRYKSALWLIKSIDQRKQTIYNVARAVMDRQSEFLRKGEKFLTPMTLKQIADEVGVHESTVSRSINGKYIETPQGVYELRYFFSSGVGNKEGTGISSNSIKKMIRELIAEEDPRSPMSDQEIMDILNSKDIEISRRTVAKYRESMNIPSSSKRRRY
ncbi:MAG: RNA polymerase factor sigma-54 [Firmicutes bacterium]|nr:RNA polymerase factor sigma-54 [Bacillota bacterium]